MRSPWHESPRRRALWYALIAAMVAAHGVLGAGVAAHVIFWPTRPEPRRIQVDLVRELEPAAPPVRPPAAPAAAPIRLARAAAFAVRAASEAQARAEAEAEAEVASAADAHAQLKARALALAAALEASAASAPGQAAASAALAAASAPPEAASGQPQPALDWPPSTRLTYTLSGDWGTNHLYGGAVVDWRREGLHYQVEFNFHLTEIFDQRMFSDGQIGDEGLQPGHYEQTRRLAFVAPRTTTVEFGADEVTLADGRQVARLPRTQDPASQFVQFVWMFTSHPDWLRPGTVVDFPLALPSSLRTWRYRVGELEPLELGFGTVGAIHLSPIVVDPRPNEYPFEIWIAPSLQYLPVQVRVELHHGNFAQVTLERKPLQASDSPGPLRGRSDLP